MLVVMVSLLGGSLPLLGKRDTVQLHLMVALSAGVFIGATFLILLSEAFHETHDQYRAFAPVVLGIVAMYVLGTVLEASGNLGPP